MKSIKTIAVFGIFAIITMMLGSLFTFQNSPVGRLIELSRNLELFFNLESAIVSRNLDQGLQYRVKITPKAYLDSKSREKLMEKVARYIWRNYPPPNKPRLILIICRAKVSEQSDLLKEYCKEFKESQNFFYPRIFP